MSEIETFTVKMTDGMLTNMHLFPSFRNPFASLDKLEEFKKIDLPKLVEAVKKNFPNDSIYAIKNYSTGAEFENFPIDTDKVFVTGNVIEKVTKHYRRLVKNTKYLEDWDDESTIFVILGKNEKTFTCKGCSIKETKSLTLQDYLLTLTVPCTRAAIDKNGCLYISASCLVSLFKELNYMPGYFSHDDALENFLRPLPKNKSLTKTQIKECVFEFRTKITSEYYKYRKRGFDIEYISTPIMVPCLDGVDWIDWTNVRREYTGYTVTDKYISCGINNVCNADNAIAIPSSNTVSNTVSSSATPAPSTTAVSSSTVTLDPIPIVTATVSPSVNNDCCMNVKAPCDCVGNKDIPETKSQVQPSIKMEIVQDTKSNTIETVKSTRMKMKVHVPRGSPYINTLRSEGFTELAYAYSEHYMYIGELDLAKVHRVLQIPVIEFTFESC